MLRALAKDATVYAVGTAAVRGIAVLLVPIYTYTLTVADYGVLETALVTLQLLLILYNAGMAPAIVRFWSDTEGGRDTADLIGSATAATALIGVSGAVLTLLFGFTLGHSLLTGPFTAWAFVGLVGAAFARSVHQQCSAVYRAMRRPGVYNGLQIAAGLVWTAACYVLMRRLHTGISGALWSQCIGFGVVALWGYVWLARREALTVSAGRARDLLKFGVPLIASMGAWFVLNASDRYFLGIYRTFTEVGEYSLGYRVASLHALGIITPLQLALAPMVFEAAKKPGLETTMGRVATAIAWTSGLSAAALAMLAPFVTRLLSPSEYARSATYTYWILPSGICLGAYYWAASLLHLRNRTTWIAGAVVVAAVVNLALNLALIPTFGPLGAAWSTDVAMLVAAVLVAALALRVQAVRLPRNQLLLAGGVSALAFAVGVGLHATRLSTAVSAGIDTAAIVAALLVAACSWWNRTPRGLLAAIRRRRDAARGAN